MYKYRLAIALIVTLVLIPVVVTAQAADDDRLPGGTTNFYTDSVETSLAPQSPLVQRITTGLNNLDPKVGIEISVPIAVDSTAFGEGGTLKLFNILRSISTMEGLQYYSASRERMRIFYEESYAVDSPENRKRIPDPLVTDIPRQDRIYAFQKDSSFGNNVQQIDYIRSGDEILLIMENTTTMYYKVVPLVTPGNLRTYILIRPHPEQEVIEFYGNLGVRVPAMFGLQDRARDSFYNRIVALHDWFVQELTAEELTR